MPKIKLAPDGERTSVDGTEAVPLSSSDSVSSWWTPISRILEYVRTAAVTFTNKTLTAPTIADFTNANHDHGDADDGGSLAASITLTTPTIADFTNAVHDHLDNDDGGTLAGYAVAAKGVTNGDSHDHAGGDGAAITDANLSTSDITTNNATTSKHGFLPKLSGDSDTYLNGDGEFTTPPGGSGNVATDTIWDAKGDLAAGTGANTAARLPGGTQGQVLTYDSDETTGMKWASGGGGVTDAEYVTSASHASLSAEVVIPGLAGSPDIAGAGGAGVSHEFDGGGSPFTWSAAVDTENIDSTVKSHVYIQDNGTETFGLYAWAPAGAFDIRAKVAMGTEGGSGAGGPFAVGLVVTDTANTSRTLIQLAFNTVSDSWRIQAFTYAASTYTQRGVDNVPGVNELYLRITRDGSNNCSFYWSTSGKPGTFLLVATQSFTFTVAKAGLRLDPASTTCQFICDWIRSDV